MSVLHEVAGDEMVLNAAFLLEKESEEHFTEAVTALDLHLEDAVNFRVVGPLPVYSFSTILFDRIDPQRFEEAKKIFGLSGEITEKAVRDTYRRLARTCHPDKNGGGSSLTFPVLNAAYRTLKSFIEHGLMHVEVYHWEQDDLHPAGTPTGEELIPAGARTYTGGRLQGTASRSGRLRPGRVPATSRSEK